MLARLTKQKAKVGPGEASQRLLLCGRQCVHGVKNLFVPGRMWCGYPCVTLQLQLLIAPLGKAHLHYCISALQRLQSCN
jgi:hypothetical protein